MKHIRLTIFCCLVLSTAILAVKADTNVTAQTTQLPGVSCSLTPVGEIATSIRYWRAEINVTNGNTPYLRVRIRARTVYFNRYVTPPGWERAEPVLRDLPYLAPGERRSFVLKLQGGQDTLSQTYCEVAVSEGVPSLIRFDVPQLPEIICRHSAVFSPPPASKFSNWEAQISVINSKTAFRNIEGRAIITMPPADSSTKERREFRDGAVLFRVRDLKAGESRSGKFDFPVRDNPAYDHRVTQYMGCVVEIDDFEPVIP